MLTCANKLGKHTHKQSNLLFFMVKPLKAYTAACTAAGTTRQYKPPELKKTRIPMWFTTLTSDQALPAKASHCHKSCSCCCFRCKQFAHCGFLLLCQAGWEVHSVSDKQAAAPVAVEHWHALPCNHLHIPWPGHTS